MTIATIQRPASKCIESNHFQVNVYRQLYNDSLRRHAPKAEQRLYEYVYKKLETRNGSGYYYEFSFQEYQEYMQETFGTHRDDCHAAWKNITWRWLIAKPGVPKSTDEMREQYKHQMLTRFCVS